MKRKQKGLLLRLLDSGWIIFANLIAFFFVSDYVQLPTSFYSLSVLLGLAIYLILAHFTGIYQQIVRYNGVKEYLTLFLCCSLAFVVKFSILLSARRTVSLRFLTLVFLFSVLFLIGSRLTWRLSYWNYFALKKQEQPLTKQALIIGAGNGADRLLNQIKQDKTPLKLVGLLDDDPDKQKTIVQGVRVLGTTNDLPRLLETKQIEQVIIAIPSLNAAHYKRIVRLAQPYQVRLSRLPKLTEPLYSESAKMQLREIDITDLLEREEVQLDLAGITKEVAGKTIMISGAGGSIGSEIVRQIAMFKPKRLLLLGHGENSIYQIQKELTSHSTIESIPLIADIQDHNLINRLLLTYKPDIVYHAAAHKHVPLMEDNPHAAVKNNVFGTYNLAHAASNAGVKTFVMISTDKAVNPPNVMGASKRLAEMIVTNLDQHSQTNFAVVRFGNVLGSRGSVVPLFKEQIANGGPLTVTDHQMTRYFMTIPEASRLVIQAGALATGGELFVLDMGKPVKIIDLARKMLSLSGETEQSIPIIETGIRPGEKLHEKLLVSSETAAQQVYNKIFLGHVIAIDAEKIYHFAENLLELSAAELKTAIIDFACHYNGEHKVERVV
ncbi:polysaccharide biosynthesis protein [Loigolactobacillus coryniformis]|uniref:polysaccharide biosynthesis protein n=1 Tax=Loigolactobacillus coryniformis TaxID=1610 RepID=UPI00345C87A3